MKKITSLLIASIISISGFSQMMVEADFVWQGAFTSSADVATTGTVQTNSGASIVAQYGGQAGFNSAVTEKLSVGFNLGYLAGASASVNTNSSAGGAAATSNGWLAIEPKLEFYPKEAYRGFYVGPKTAFSLGIGKQSQSALNLGAKLGWMFPLGESVRLGIDWAIGYSKSFNKSFEYTDATTNEPATQDIPGGGGLFTGFNLRIGYMFGK